MKKVMTIFGVVLFASVILTSCGGGSKNEFENKIVNTSVDLCKCLTEPGNSEWATENKDACRDAISKELGVENWEKVNFSKEPELNRKWDLLVKKCTGSKEVKTGVEQIDRNSELVKEIGTSYGYVWESINTEAQIYTTLAFDGLICRTTAYSMNGKTNSEDFTKVIDLSGKWNAIDNVNAEGVYEQNNVSISWKFNEDYSNLTNNKGVVFQRVSEQKLTNGSSESAMVEKKAKVTTNPSVSEPKDKLVKNKVNTSAKSVSSVSGKYSEASEKLFTKAELSKYNNSKLRLIRNEIFARHGYIFKAKDLSDYFNKQEWYRPKFKDVMSKLTSIEKKNIALIETFENK